MDIENKILMFSLPSFPMFECKVFRSHLFQGGHSPQIRDWGIFEPGFIPETSFRDTGNVQKILVSFHFQILSLCAHDICEYYPCTEYFADQIFPLMHFNQKLVELLQASF